MRCQTEVTAKAVSHLHPKKYKQMKDTRPIEGIVSAKTRSASRS